MPEGIDGVEAKAESPVLDMDAKVTVEGKQVLVRDLIAQGSRARDLEGENEKLKSFREATLQLTRDDLDAATRAKYAKQILVDGGLSEADAQRWADEAAGEVEQEDEGDGEEAPAPRARGRKRQDEEVQEELRKVREELEEVRGQGRRTAAQRLAEELDRSVEKSLDADEKGRELIGKLADIRGEDGAEKGIRRVMQEEVRRQAMENLRVRSERSGTFSESWVGEETVRAAQQVLGRYRSVIGDVNRLGRAPETGSGEGDVFVRPRTPVPPPKPRAKARPDESDLDAYINYELMEGVRKGAQGPSRA